MKLEGYLLNGKQFLAKNKDRAMQLDTSLRVLI